MSRELNGWEQPEEKLPEDPQEKAEFEVSEIDIEIPDGGADGEGEIGPEFLIDMIEAEESRAEKRPHRRIEPPAPERKRHRREEPAPKPESEPDESQLVLEDVLMIEEEAREDAEKPRPAKAPAGKAPMFWKRRSHSYAAPLGLAFIILALAGLAALVLICVQLTMNILDNTEEKSAFEWKVYPLLMFDPAAFESPAQLDEAFVLKTALWKTLLENRAKYSYNDSGMLVVPASDLDVAAKSLYGDVIKLSHQSFSEGYEFFYIYDEAQNAYLVPVQGQTAQYSPKVVKISRDENVYTLMVGYVPPNDLWNIDTEGNMTEPSPSKYMYYDLQRTESGGYYILAVREVPKEELPADAGASGQQQLNQTRYEEYVDDFMSSQGADGAYSQSGAEAATGAESGAEAPSGESSETESGASDESSQAEAGAESESSAA